MNEKIEAAKAECYAAYKASLDARLAVLVACKDPDNDPVFDAAVIAAGKAGEELRAAEMRAREAVSES